MSSQPDQPLAYLKLASNFLQLAEGACEQLVKSINPSVVVTKAPISPAQYARRTRWSDHSIGVPILFNFFHGIELLLKGFLATSNSTSTGHKLSQLLAKFEEMLPGTKLGATIEKFVRNIDQQSPLGEFIAMNSIHIDDWYEALKYPKSMRGKSFSHKKLKYGGGKTIQFWSSIGSGSALLRKQAVTLANSLRP